LALLTISGVWYRPTPNHIAFTPYSGLPATIILPFDTSLTWTQ
jgi:hypothetical protein